MSRSEIIEKVIDLAEELAPDDSPLGVHLRAILMEFGRKLADQIYE